MDILLVVRYSSILIGITWSIWFVSLVHDHLIEDFHVYHTIPIAGVFQYQELFDQVNLIFIFRKNKIHLKILVQGRYFGDQEIVQDYWFKINHHDISDTYFCDDPLEWSNFLGHIYWFLVISNASLVHIDDIGETKSDTRYWSSHFCA